jgi:hypothetical protein
MTDYITQALARDSAWLEVGIHAGNRLTRPILIRHGGSKDVTNIVVNREVYPIDPSVPYMTFNAPDLLFAEVKRLHDLLRKQNEQAFETAQEMSLLRSKLVAAVDTLFRTKTLDTASIDVVVSEALKELVLQTSSAEEALREEL